MHRQHIRLLPLSLIALLLLGLVAVVTSPARAAVAYYVAPGGNNSHPGTFTQPWATFAYTMSQINAGVVKPGDTVNFRAGTYPISGETVEITASGTATARITIQSYPGDTQRAVLDGQGLNPGPDRFSGNDVFTVNRAQYITIKGFEIKNSTRNGVNCYECKNLRVQQNIVHDHLRSGIGAYAEQLGIIDNVEVDGNIVYRNVLENQARTLSSTWAPAIVAFRASNFKVTNNTVYQNYGEGIDFVLVQGGYATGNTVYDNYSVNLYLDNATDITLSKNFAYTTNNPAYYRTINGVAGPASGIQIANETEGYNGTKNPTERNTIVNNIVVNGRYGVFVGAYQGGAPLKNTVIANNTFYAAQSELIFIETSGHLNSTIANNIVVKTGGSAAMTWIPSPAGISFKNNLWYGGGAGNAAGTGDVNANPLLLNGGGTSANDYKLTASSPAINTGTSSGAPTSDYFGAARPQSGAFDIGAHEVGGSPVPTATPTRTPTAGPTPTAMPSPTPTSAPTGTACQVVYDKYSDWGSGFSVNLRIKNTGTTAINGWTLRWTYAGNQTVTSAWNASYTQSGQQVSVSNAGYNGSIAPGGSVADLPGFNGTYSSSNTNPSVFDLNGVRCT